MTDTPSRAGPFLAAMLDDTMGPALEADLVDGDNRLIARASAAVRIIDLS